MNFKKEIRTEAVLLCCTLILCFLNVGTSPVIHAITADSALFMTMGRAVTFGKVLYRDIFDHKGLYIFLVNALGAWIQGTGLTGHFLVETAVLCIDALLVYRICRFWLTEKQSLFAAVMFMAFGTNYFVFLAGNIVEEYALPFQLYSLFLIIRYLQSDSEPHSYKEMFLHGICGGFCFWLRANLILMWAPFAILVLSRELREKRGINALKNILYGLSGLLVISLPVLFYGMVFNCMDEMIYGTFTFNFQYTGAHGSGFLGNLLSTLLVPYEGPLFLFCLLSSAVLWKKKASVFSLSLFALMFFFCFFAASLSGRAYWQYYTYLLPFAIPFFAWLSKTLSDMKFPIPLGLVLVLLGGIGLGLVFPARILALFFDRKVTIYEKCREDYETCARLKQEYYPSSNQVLVTGGNSQFYMEMNTVPELRYPFALSMSYEEFPDPYEEQLSSILQGKDDVVILVNESYDKEKIEPIYEGLMETEVNKALDMYYRLVYTGETTGTRMFVRK